MKHFARAIWTVLACLVLVPAWAAPPQAGHAGAAPAIPPEAAREVFAEAARLCGRDDGRLWGESLCAPIMLADRATRQIVASHPDAGGVLQLRDGVYVGVLPVDQNIANTAMEWSGTRWTQLMWPLPDDPALRAIIIAHELFHNLQPRLPIRHAGRGISPHLDTMQGRYYLQLEWRALARALQAGQPDARKQAIADALAFRDERFRLFPDARETETARAFNEGLAEYTGVVAGSQTPKARRDAALRDLRMLVENDASFVRSLASGPAYGLLLDELVPDWKSRLETIPPAAILREAIGEEAVAAVDPDEAAGRYEGASLRAAETAREQRRLAQARRNRARFVDGPVLTIEFEDMNLQFNPSNLQPLEGVGMVYPTLRVTDAWGQLEAENGALIKDDWSAVVVTAPKDANADPVRGDGWTLVLEPEWELVRDGTRGNYLLRKVAE